MPYGGQQVGTAIYRAICEHEQHLWVCSYCCHGRAYISIRLYTPCIAQLNIVFPSVTGTLCFSRGNQIRNILPVIPSHTQYHEWIMRVIQPGINI
jgi:hypothetical protein